jgi:hypothetical protein
LIPKSLAHKGLNDQHAVYQGVTDGIVKEAVYNHTLGGLWFGEEVPTVGQPDGVMSWGGAANLIWFASRKHGVAGFAGSQVLPPGDPRIIEVFEAWKKDLFAAWRGQYDVKN